MVIQVKYAQVHGSDGDDLPVSRQSPIQVVTGLSVEQLCWWRPMR